MKRHNPNIVSIADKYIGKDGSAPKEPSENELDAMTVSLDQSHILAGLGEMSPAEYGRKRDVLAADLDMPRAWLDAEFKERRKAAKASAKSAAIDDWAIDAWPDPVDGGELLDSLKATATAHLVLPAGAAETIALWALFAHAHDCFQISPVLAVTSPTPECGKTTLLTLLGGIVPRPLPGSNITSAALFRAVEKWQPTVLVDEADTFLRESDELRGVINSGHNKAGAFVIRTVGDDHEPARFRTWAPKAIALIGKLPATLASRSLHIELRRRTAAETVAPLRLDRLDHLAPLQRMAGRWTADNRKQLSQGEPEMPAAIYGRAADNWRPLLAIADAAGGEWPARARRIAERLSANRTESTPNIMLLEDVRRIFSDLGREQMKTSEMISALTVMDDRPWPEWKGGKPITPRQLARLLEPFEIAPWQFWDGGKHRGYDLAQFNDAFSRYLGDESGRTVEARKKTIFGASHPVRADTGLPGRECQEASENMPSTALPDEKPGKWGCDQCGGQDEPDNEVLAVYDRGECHWRHRGCLGNLEGE